MPEPEVAATPTETPAPPVPEPTASPAAEESAPAEAVPAPEATEEGGGEEVQPTSEELLTTLAEHVAEREKASAKKGLSEAQSRMQPLLQRQQREMEGINRGIQDFAGDFSEWREDPTTDNKALDKLLTRHGPTFDALNKVYLETGGWTGWIGFVKNMSVQTQDPDLAKEFLPRLSAMAQGDEDAGFWPDIAEHLTDIARKEGKEEGRKLGNKESDERHAAQARTNGRKGEAPPAKVAAGAGGSGKSDREKKLDPDTPVSELEEIRAREQGR